MPYYRTYPISEYYCHNTMHPDDREVFMRWYEEHKGDRFVFQDELLKYCRTDVDILRKACLIFRKLLMDTTAAIDGVAIDPFERCITIASACNLIFRSKFLAENTIALIPPLGYQPERKQSIKAMQWLKYIAQTENIRIQHIYNGGEKRIGPYCVDGYTNGTAYEFNGCFWHGCLRCYSMETKNPVNDLTMGELYQRTLDKQKYIEDHGYTYICKWECDFNKEINEKESLRGLISEMDLLPPLEPRDAFYGGRTEAFTLYHDKEQINYYDVTSLYPFVNKTGKMPVGHPRDHHRKL